MVPTLFSFLVIFSIHTHMKAVLGQLKLMATHGVQQKRMRMEHTSWVIWDAAAKHAL